MGSRPQQDFCDCAGVHVIKPHSPNVGQTKAQDRKILGGAGSLKLAPGSRVLSATRSWGALSWRCDGTVAVVDYCASVGFGGGEQLWMAAREDALGAGCVGA